jgi:hypothetical protein
MLSSSPPSPFPTRYVDPRDYEKEADHIRGSLKEIPPLIRNDIQ